MMTNFLLAVCQHFFWQNLRSFLNNQSYSEVFPFKCFRVEIQINKSSVHLQTMHANFEQIKTLDDVNLKIAILFIFRKRIPR